MPAPGCDAPATPPPPPEADERGGKCRARSEESTNLAGGVEKVVRPPGAPVQGRVHSSLLATHTEAVGIIGIPIAKHPRTFTA